MVASLLLYYTENVPVKVEDIELPPKKEEEESLEETEDFDEEGEVEE